MISKIKNLLIYFLRYYSILSTTYEVTDKINFGSSLSNNYFKKNLRKCNFYLEYGSGNSTFLANKLHKKYKSIEADKSFYRFMKTKKIRNIKYLDLGPTKYYSIPILPTNLIKKKIEKYAIQIEEFYKTFNKIPDLILLDGRFRVFVTLKIIKFCLSKKDFLNTIIIIDDFKFRKDYHLIKKIINMNLVGRFGVIKLNKKLKINKIKLDEFLKISILNYI